MNITSLFDATGGANNLMITISVSAWFEEMASPVLEEDRIAPI